MNRKKRILYAATMLEIGYEHELWRVPPEDLQVEGAIELCLAISTARVMDLLRITTPELTLDDWAAAGECAAKAYPRIIEAARAERPQKLQA